MATIRKTFPRVYRLADNRTGNPYYLVSARSLKWGLNERKAFPTEGEALDYAKRIEARLQANGALPLVPVEVKRDAAAYASLRDALTPHGKTPEDAVAHYINYLGQLVVQSVKPFLAELVTKWIIYKSADTTLNPRTLTEAKFYGNFISKHFGQLKPDELKKNTVDLLLKGLDVSNNTRKKHLLYIRMFLRWVMDEAYLSTNPTDGIKFKADDFEAEFYTPDEIKNLLQWVTINEPLMIGYYSILTFAGLRPTEGARVQWEDINFNTGQLYVRKGKTEARHIHLEPVMLDWLKFHKYKNPDAPFVPGATSLAYRERQVREAMPKWIQDGLRHSFATYFRNLKKDINLTSETMGNSPHMVKKHYARTIEWDKVQQFWAMTPAAIIE